MNKTTTNSEKKLSPRSAASFSAAQSAEMRRRQALAEKINRERLMKLRSAPKKPTATPSYDPIAAKADREMKAKKSAALEKKRTEKKDSAVESALRSVATMEKGKKPEKKLKNSRFFSMKRILLALTCSAIIVGAIVFVVQASSDNISQSVAALQAGFDVSAPSYIPREYNITSTISEEGKVSMTYTNSEGASFTLTEELSSWDSATLEANYVKEKFIDYVPIREQGLTLFISGSDCIWVNGGKLFEIDASGNNLTKKQIKAIAVSL